MSERLDSAYEMAQAAIAQLKASVRVALSEGPKEGLRNVDIGKSLGIYMGHVEHVGHIPRTLLEIMQKEGVVTQDADTKLWKLNSQVSED
ncbi:hypothetical protein FHY55_07410 [Oceanicola sp. D3]|uniref:hypothetical protein n=1 Tax=Oceanicola sp. D3 TaxID=2587163 RepID=UPI001123EDD6|nr:hypothetical protein [Oceanicola sp. D3]QDC09079.1 hypothetical protein FHY55_07410 [Oceanicola sp. D3]